MAGGSGKSKTPKKVPVWDLPDVPTGKLPPHLELQRTRVLWTRDAPTHTENIGYSGAYASMGVDNSLRLEEFRENFRVEVIDIQGDDMEFDLIGIDAAIANAFRRIIIAEIPTMAIEKVLVANNTSVLQDESLALRLGLIPIKVDPRLFDFMSENDEPNEKNTIVFKLHAICPKEGKPIKKEKGSEPIQGEKGSKPIQGEKVTKPIQGEEGNKPIQDEKKSQRIQVNSDELIWLPNGSEFTLSTGSSTLSSTSKAKTYTSFNCSQDSLPELSNTTIAPADGSILITKLGPGQELELEGHAVKGIGATHAKWSPVATAWYRMHPEIVLLQDIEDEKAEELVEKCPLNVFDIEDIGKGRKRATVARPRSCSLCRECIRGGDWDKLVALRSIKDHFIFKIESTGALPPEVLFTEAVKILEDKCERVITELS